MSTKIKYSFKHFADSISIFDLVERHFPFNNYREDFDQRLNNNPTIAFLDAELSRIENNYQEQGEIGWFGFNSRLERRNHSVKTLTIDFLIWKEKWHKTLLLPYKIKGKSISDEEYSELAERTFFEFLAKGVNDAQLKELILELKREKQFTTGAKPQRNNDIPESQWTHLTRVLKVYFESGGKKIKREQFINSIKVVGSRKRLESVINNFIKSGYDFKDHHESVKAYYKAYQLLLNYFQDSNVSAYNLVKGACDKIENNYSQYI